MRPWLLVQRRGALLRAEKNCATFVWHYLSNTPSFDLCVLRRVKDHHALPYYPPRLKNSCIRQVVLDKWFPRVTHMILDTTKNAQNERGCIRQVALDRYCHPGYLWAFTSRDLEFAPRSVCVDSSPQQISLTLVGHCTVRNGSLRKSPPFSVEGVRKNCEEKRSNSWLAKFPSVTFPIKSRHATELHKDFCFHDHRRILKRWLMVAEEKPVFGGSYFWRELRGSQGMGVVSNNGLIVFCFHFCTCSNPLVDRCSTPFPGDPLSSP